ncbi:MAG: mucoidy inhibitor MuiA family protein [Thermoguttaceae bacterium]
MLTTVRSSVRVLIAVLLAVAARPSLSADPPANEAVGRVTHVTLYRGQAMVSRTIPLEGPPGAQELVVKDLPEQVVAGSLFAEGGEAIEVRAVRFRTRAVGQEPREEVRKLDLAIEAVNEKLAAEHKTQEVLAQRGAYLDQMEGFVVPTAKTDLARGFLDAAALQKITLFSFEQRETIAEKLLAAQKQVKRLNEEVALLQRKREELTKGAAHTVREAVLFLEKRGEGKDSVRLNYLVGSCGWSPTYAIRAGKDGKEVSIECSALIQQLTGEDWTGVTLTLSTASPALSAAGLGLAPFPITLSRDYGRRVSTGELATLMETLHARKGAAVAENRNALSLSENIASGWMANTAANDLQSLELASGEDVLNTIQTREGQTSEGPSLSYQLSAPVSLASRSDQQMVRILQTAFKSRFYYVATPVLTGYVYREAELTNTSQEDLLAGPIMVYLDGRFVGHSEIPTVARGQTFVVGFGADPQLRARRELAGRTENIQGGNRELSFKYRLVLENFKDQPAVVRLFDRLPYSDRPNDVRIKLADLKDPLSKDELYVRTERPKGILRWEIETPASATGEKVRIVEYAFTLDFDRNFALRIPGAGGQAAPAPAQEKAQQEFEIQQRARLTK